MLRGEKSGNLGILHLLKKVDWTTYNCFKLINAFEPSKPLISDKFNDFTNNVKSSLTESI